MELAIENVPAIDGRVFVCPDVSGSMRSPVTGAAQGRDDHRPVRRRGGAGGGGHAPQEPGRGGAAVRARVVPVRLSARDSVMTNAERAGGGQRRRHARERAAGAR